MVEAQGIIKDYAVLLHSEYDPSLSRGALRGLESSRELQGAEGTDLGSEQRLDLTDFQIGE